MFKTTLHPSPSPHPSSATLETKLARVRVGVEGRCAEEAEGQRRMVTEQLLDMLDEESRGEMTDNAWLKKEVRRKCFPFKFSAVKCSKPYITLPSFLFQFVNHRFLYYVIKWTV